MVSDLKVGSRLLGGFLAVALLVAVVGGIGMKNIAKVTGYLRSVYEDRVVPMEQLKLISDAYAVRIVDITHKVRSGQETWDTGLAEVRTARTVIDENWQRFEATDLTPEEARLAEATSAVMHRADEVVDELEGILARRDSAALTAFADSTLYAGIDPVTDAVTGLADLQLSEAKKLYEEAEVARAAVDRESIAAIVLAIAGALGLGLLLSRGITRPLARVVERAEQLQGVDIAALGRASRALAEGDLDVSVAPSTEPLEVTSKDEIGELARSVDGIIIQTRATTESFTAAAAAVRGLVEQAASLADSARRGDLSERGDTSAFEGAYGQVVQGVNQMLDSVARPLDEAAVILERVAERDLSARMTGEYEGQYARIKESVNQAVSNLDDALDEVQGAARQVAAAAEQINADSQRLAEGSTEQASSLEEVSSSLQEMSSMSAQSLGNAREARGLAEDAGRSTQSGTDALERLTTAMGQIKTASDDTARIVKTIDEIAFQTNLLALNAAVEAARAGEAGKGFAVVAEEVRNLAIRSAEAAKETARLIEESVRSAEEGVELQNDVVARLGEIEQGVFQVRDVMSEIAAASEQQSVGVGQINTAVEDMNAVTQTTAASAEESASTSEELTAQAAQLRALVDRFSLSASETGAEKPVRARSRLDADVWEGCSPDTYPETLDAEPDDAVLARF